MPFYDFICPKKHKSTDMKSFDEYDRADWGACPVCNGERGPVSANNICVYGTDRYSDDTLKDASQAAGFKITNTKQVDKLEKEGKMYRVTNPSTYHHKNDKNKASRDAKWKERMRRAF